MSNCLKIPPVEVEIETKVLSDIPPDAQDTDGNKVRSDIVGREVLFIPAEFTTWREFKNFIRKHVAPYIADEFKDQVHATIPGVREESDDFNEEFNLNFRFSLDYDKITSFHI